MKFYIDKELVFELTQSQEDIIKHDIPEEEFLSDMKRRIQWVVMHKYTRSFKRLKDEWIPKLKESGVASMSLDDDKLSRDIFRHANYKNRSARIKEEKERFKKA